MIPYEDYKTYLCECGQHSFRVPDGFGIQRVKCPVCGETIVGGTEKVEARPHQTELQRVQKKAGTQRVDASAHYHELWNRWHSAVTSMAEYRTFLSDIGCGSCLKGFQRIVGKVEQHQLVDWWWKIDMHNAVNRKLGKPHFTDAQAIEKYGLKPRGQHQQAN